MPLSLLLLMVTCRSWWAVEGRRVLVIPMPHTSHAKYQINIARELRKLGHEVWITMPDFMLAKGVLDTSDLGVVEYSPDSNVEEHTISMVREPYFREESVDLPQFFEEMKQFCYTLLKNETFFEEIKKLKAQFFIIDNVLLNELTVIPYRLGVPFAYVGSVYDPIRQRVPFSPVVTPIPLFPFSDRMNIAEKLQNALLYLQAYLIDHQFQSTHVVSTYAPEMPPLQLSMLVAQAEIWLVEMDHILDYPRPSMPNVKLIGGTATGPAKPLPPRFQSFMDRATQGVVIVTFGSYVLGLPKDLGDKVLQMLLQLPLKSIFRSNLTSPDPDKIITAPWIPQNDLLGHPNTKVFFSHCGKNGQYEALYHAVPIVAAPMFVDQDYNAKRAQVKGFSETVDLRTATAEELAKAVLKVATEKRYKRAISKASELFRIEFGVPKETAAFWLDHVMKYGGAHMRSAAQDMPYYQFIGLDILLIMMGTVFVVISVFFVCCYFSVKWLCLRKQKRKVE
ncbi:UDP-glucuronosyltransferase 1A7-like [Babylonia areolata]|uniref:UDP-glucuronosyltransferase 1A7-like n=1 Tax=Babylonia areolata TaxID=304850 RepID=UPI003FD1FF54